MNYLEAKKYLEELVKTGMFRAFVNKSPSEMTPKELDLYEFDDGEHFYNPWAGELSEFIDEGDSILSLEQVKALGLLKGMTPRSFSDMTEEEQKLFSDDED